MTKQMLLLLEAHIHHAWKKASKILYVTNLDAFSLLLTWIILVLLWKTANMYPCY